MLRFQTPFPGSPCELHVIHPQLYRDSGPQEVVEGTECERLPEVGPPSMQMWESHHGYWDETF